MVVKCVEWKDSYLIAQVGSVRSFGTTKLVRLQTK
jgi:hypothetical protein